MWQSIESQLKSAFDSLIRNDKAMARDILLAGNSISVQGSMVDKLCEDYIAEFAPKEEDLRLVLSMLKINHNLKRIGYFVGCIAHFILYQQSKPFSIELAKDLQIYKMLDITLKMTTLAKCSFDTLDAAKANRVLGMERVVDEINNNAIDVIVAYIKDDTDRSKEFLSLMLAIRKIERVCDKLSSVAKNVIKYIDAKKIFKEINNYENFSS